MSVKTPSSYSKLDRALHKLAFNSKPLQDILGDMEQGLFAKQWQEIVIEKPIFITSLPRAGTTIVLETLYRISNLATHTYRDMPFILMPVIWQKVSRLFRQTSKLKERAHGDGLAINEDSPEAFEEVLWKKYFPGQYSPQGITCWPDALGQGGFEELIRAHMQKIVMLRRKDGSDIPRYISKNNANIARIGYIQSLFPDALFVVPVRHPVEQAISLLRQHQNFVKQHANDAFTQEYMADIGHYEFGELHRPILFPGLAEIGQNLTPDSIDYWIAYWIAAFRHLSQHQNVHFLSHETLCLKPESSLNSLLECLGLPADRESIQEAAQTIKSSSNRRPDGYTADRMLLEQAQECYQSLQGRCLLGDELRI